MAPLAVAIPPMASASVAPATYVARFPARELVRDGVVALTNTSGVLGNGRRTTRWGAGCRLGSRRSVADLGESVTAVTPPNAESFIWFRVDEENVSIGSSPDPRRYA
jgi:hypothetical protein